MFLVHEFEGQDANGLLECLHRVIPLSVLLLIPMFLGKMILKKKRSG